MLAAVWVIVIAVYILSARLHDSPWGRTLRAIRDNEGAAECSGVPKALPVRPARQASR